jgi:hypothetical protein
VQSENDWLEIARERLPHKADGVAVLCAWQQSLTLSVHVDVVHCFADLAQTWIAERELFLAYSTIRKYKRYLNRWALTRWRSTPALALRPPDVEDWLKDLTL